MGAPCRMGIGGWGGWQRAARRGQPPYGRLPPAAAAPPSRVQAGGRASPHVPAATRRHPPALHAWLACHAMHAPGMHRQDGQCKRTPPCHLLHPSPRHNDDIEAQSLEVAGGLHNGGQRGQVQGALLRTDQRGRAHLDHLRSGGCAGVVLSGSRWLAQGMRRANYRSCRSRPGATAARAVAAGGVGGLVSWAPVPAFCAGTWLSRQLMADRPQRAVQVPPAAVQRDGAAAADPWLLTTVGW